MSLYEKYVLPKFLNCACGSKPVSYQRKKVVPHAEGKVLEIGIGSGLNLPFYDKSKIEELWGLDPSEELSKMAKEVAIQEGIDVKFVSSGAGLQLVVGLGAISGPFLCSISVYYTNLTLPTNHYVKI